MHLFGYDASSHKLYLPRMYGSVYDVLVKKKANDKFVKEDSVRIQVVHTTLEALLRGMVNLHENGVAHRDIKLENLLLSSDMKTVKIADFGVGLLFYTSSFLCSNIPMVRLPVCVLPTYYTKAWQRTSLPWMPRR